MRFSNAFFCFNWNSSLQSWFSHSFHFHLSKFFIEDLTCCCRESAISLCYQLRWSFLKNLFITRWCKIDWTLFSFSSDVFAFIVSSLTMKSFVVLTFAFFLTLSFFDTLHYCFNCINWTFCVHINDSIL